MINVLERPRTCGYPTSECDGLTYNSVDCTTAKNLSVNIYHIVELHPDGCAQAQAASTFDHSNNVSDTKQGCLREQKNPR